MKIDIKTLIAVAILIWAGFEHDKWLKTATPKQIQDVAQAYYEDQSDHD